jgi:hypothetical protein
MVSSYTSNTGIEKPASGDQSGTWGDTTNTNFDIIDRALNGVAAITLSGTSHTLTTTDGTLSDGMFKVLVLGGSPSGTNTITIDPNDADKVYFVYNNTAQTATFSQGSGANVSIPAGGADIIYADGAGSGAAVASIFANPISFGKVTVSSDTAAGDQASMGYTSTEGLILTGQGSTNDVTIKNDADADVLEIPTGTTNVTVVGDITAGGDLVSTGTVNPAGDTSASDAAAIGYTASEGIIITGQGSTNDVTIKNDADADVLEIPTGTTNVTVVGNVTAGGDLVSTGTVNPAGDTSSGDAAAVGYTAAEGLILTGQGSTSDVTIKNDADATVFSIATGTTTGTFAGTVLAKTDTDTTNTGNVTLDFTANQNFVLTLTGNVTLDNPSTEQVGQAGVIVFIQDGTGGRTVSLGTDYETPAGAGLTLSSTASAVDIVPYFVKASGSIQLGTPQLAFS